MFNLTFFTIKMIIVSVLCVSSPCTPTDPALVQMEAGNRALKAVFASKLAAKGKSLAELLQPHSTGKICGGVNIDELCQ